MRSISLALVAFSGMALAGCGDGGPTTPTVVVSVEVSPANDTLTVLGVTRQFSAVAKDASGSTIAGKIFEWSSTAPGVATVDAGSGLVTAVTQGSTNIRATVDAVSGSATVTIIQLASVLSVQTQPAGAQSSVPFLTQPVVELQDANGNRVSDDSTVISVRIGTGGGTLLGTTQVAARAGLASFDDLAISGPAGARTLQFTASGFATVMSDTFAIASGPSTSDTIGTDGGTLALADGASIFFPEGAVVGEVVIQFRDTSDVIPWYTGLSDRGYVVELSVLGVNTSYSLGDSIRITLPIDPAKVSGGRPYVRAVFSNLPTESFVAPAAFAGNDSLVIAIPAIGLAELDTTLLGDHVLIMAEEIANESQNAPGDNTPSRFARRESTAIVECDDFPVDHADGSKMPQFGDVAVVLVHGWLPNVADCGSFKQEQRVLLGRDLPGKKYFDALLPALVAGIGDQHPIYVFTYPSYLHYRTSGLVLGSRLGVLEEEVGFVGVIFVGHSMGGLVSRYAAQTLQSTGYGGLARGVITLATPHLGTELPSSALLAKTFFAPAADTPGGQSLLPKNKLDPEEEVPIFAFGGDVSNRRDDLSLMEKSIYDELCKLHGEEKNCAADTAVLVSSALPDFIQRGRAHPVLDYTHTELHEGQTADDPLHESIFADIVALAPVDLLDFETYPDGSPACSACPVTNEYSFVGVLFSFSSPLTAETRAWLGIVPAFINPANPNNHLVSFPFPLGPDGGQPLGTLRVDFTQKPTLVRFEIVHNDLVLPTLSAFDANGDPLALQTQTISTYQNPWGFTMRRTHVTVEDVLHGVGAVLIGKVEDPGSAGVDNMSIHRSEE